MEVMLGRQIEIKPLGQPGQYVTSLPLPLFNDNEQSYWLGGTSQLMMTTWVSEGK